MAPPTRRVRRQVIGTSRARPQPIHHGNMDRQLEPMMQNKINTPLAQMMNGAAFKATEQMARKAIAADDAERMEAAKWRSMIASFARR